MNYLLSMGKTDWKEVLWLNVKARMNTLYGKENLSRLIKDSGVGPGTITRIKEQGTSVGVDVIEKVATALKVDPWQLMHPKLGEIDLPSNRPLAPVDIAQAAIKGVATLEQSLEGLATYLATLDDSDRREAMKMIASLSDSPERHARLPQAFGEWWVRHLSNRTKEPRSSGPPTLPSVDESGHPPFG